MCSPQRPLTTSARNLDKNKSRSTHNCLEAPVQSSKCDNIPTFTQPCVSTSIALSMSTSSSNLSASSKISSTSSLSTNNAIPSLEVVGTSSRLSPSPFSSNVCTPRRAKCHGDIDEKHQIECANIKKAENTQALIPRNTVNLNSKRPKSSPALEMGNIVIKSDVRNNLNLRNLKNIKSTLKNLIKNKSNEQCSSSTDVISPSRMSPSKRGARRIRSREIIEELQVQVNLTRYQF